MFLLWLWRKAAWDDLKPRPPIGISVDVPANLLRNQIEHISSCQLLPAGEFLEPLAHGV